MAGICGITTTAFDARVLNTMGVSGQSKLIRTWKPWEKSTGPRSPEGKVKVSLNAYKGGYRSKLRALARAMRDQRITLNDLKEEVAENLGGQI